MSVDASIDAGDPDKIETSEEEIDSEKMKITEC